MSTSTNQPSNSQSMSAKIEDLLLDETNPRFGELERGTEQSQLVDLIISKFGIEDVLSSLAINGFFAAEPLVCTKRDDGKLIVKEGNRRLCASIILTGDKRASNQTKLTERSQKIWVGNGSPQIEPIPVLVFEEKGDAAEKMLSYLGVRHISSAQPWDSYAKASWVARVSDDTGLPVSKITEMVGDQHSTVVRLLEGYRFIQQLITSGFFRAEDSQRKGRGSVTEFPFSWIYTMLGFKSARDFVGLTDIKQEKNPINPEKLENAAALVSAMFGNRSQGRSAAIEDSRQLADLARAFSDPEKVALLKAGRDLTYVEEITKPIELKLEENLEQARYLLSNLISSMSETPPSLQDAEKYMPTANKTRQLSSDVYRRLRDIFEGDIDSASE